MAYRKSTLRSMSPVTRKVARLIGEQESVARRFKNLVPEIQRLELDSQALTAAKQTVRTEYELRAEITAMQDKSAELPPLDCGRGIYGTRIAVLAWVLGDTSEKPSEH